MQDEQEQRYLGTIEAFTEEFGRIQREFVLQKHGVKAIVRFIEDFSGQRPAFEKGDPVLAKGQAAFDRAVEALKGAHAGLEGALPPPAWVPFHRTLLESVRLQIEGYEEMVRVFEDSDLGHLKRGKVLVKRGMGLLEAGER